MPVLKLVAEDQIRRTNLLVQNVKTLESLPPEVLLQKPTAKSWCILEIIEHMNIAYEIYRPRIDKLLNTLPDTTEEQSLFKAHIFPKLFIQMIKPKGTQRKWKIKTLQHFEPKAVPTSFTAQEINTYFERFYDNKAHLKKAILDSRFKRVGQKRLVSGIGPIVKFYLPEAFEFIVSHAERHFLQIQETEAVVNKAKAQTHGSPL